MNSGHNLPGYVEWSYGEGRKEEKEDEDDEEGKERRRGGREGVIQTFRRGMEEDRKTRR